MSDRDGLQCCLQALKILLGWEREKGSKKSELLKNLECNFKAFKEFIAVNKSIISDDSFGESLHLLTKNELPTDTTGQYIVNLSELLSLLPGFISTAQSSESPGKPALGAVDTAVVQTAVQTVVCLGAWPCLEVGVVPPVRARLHASTLPSLPGPPACSSSLQGRCAMLHLAGKTLAGLVGVAGELRAAATSSCLLDLLAVLLTLTHHHPTVQAVGAMTTNPPPEDHAPLAPPPKAWLNTVLSCVPTSQLVQALVQLQSPKQLAGGRESPAVPAPKWLRRACGRLLTHLLLRPRGLGPVVEGLLSSTTLQGDSPEWKRYDLLARIVCTCPSHLKEVEYLEAVCPQVVDILHSSPPVSMAMACEAIVSCCLELHPLHGPSLLLHALITPLRTLAAEVVPQKLTIPEEDLTLCLQTLHQLVGVSHSDSALIPALAPYLPVLFHLWVSAMATITHHKTRLQELVVDLLLLCDKSQACAFFGHLARLGEGAGPGFRAVRREDGSVEMGDGGGLRVVFGPAPPTTDSPALDRKVALAVQLLAEDLKELLLLGDVCLLYFGHLASVLGTTIGASPPGSSGSSGVCLEGQSSPSLTADLFCLCVTAELCEGHMTSLLLQTAPDTLLGPVQSVLANHEAWLREGRQEDSEPFGGHLTLTMATGMLSALLTSNPSVHSTHFSHLKNMIPLLRFLGDHHPIDELATVCGNLHLCIATLGAVGAKCGSHGDHKREGATKEAKQRESPKEDTPRGEHPFKEKPAEGDGPADEDSGSKMAAAVTKMADPSVPVRAQGVQELSALLRAGDPECLQHSQLVMDAFCQQLKDSDTFVYLPAINGLVAMVTLAPQRTIPLLVDEFVTAVSGCHGNSSSEGKRLAVQLKLGEAMMRAVRVCGPSLPAYHRHFMRGLLLAMRSPAPLVRASALSGMAELCGLLHHSLPAVLQEVLRAVEEVVSMETEVEVRRAACLLVCQMFTALDTEVVEVLQGTLRDFYRVLKKVVAMETDEIALAHARASLDALDHSMRALLFPPPSFEKRIRVLPSH